MAGSEERRPEDTKSGTAFVICQIGAPNSEVRARTDELCDFILRPPLAERGLRLARADEDPTPGTVSVQIVQAIVNATVVLADLTGRNANVYYELGIAHSFAKPLIILVDKTSSLAFDLQGERAIVIDDDGREIGARKAASAANEVRKQLGIVTTPGYVPQSLVRSAGVSASLTQFASDDPMSAQVVRISDQLEEIRNHLFPQGTFIPTASDFWPDYTHHRTGFDVLRPRVTPSFVRRFREKVGVNLTTHEAVTVLHGLTPQDLYVLSRIWGLHGGGELGSPEDLAAELNIPIAEAADLWRRVSRRVVVDSMAFRSSENGDSDDLEAD